MNNSTKVFWPAVLAGLLLFRAGICGAQDKLQLPTPPYVAAVPDFFQWAVTIEDNKGRPAQTPARDETGKTPRRTPLLQKVIYTKTRDIQRNTLVYDDGTSFEDWYSKNYVIVRAANGEFLVNAAGTYGANAVETGPAARGFFGVDWITVADFRARKKLSNGLDVYVYARGSDLEAAIAVDSRLPLVVKKDGQTYAYSYGTPPSQMLVLPADMQKEVSAIEEKIDFVQKLRSAAGH